MEKVKKQHGIDISKIESLEELDTIVTRSKGVNTSLKTPTILQDLTNLKWLETGEHEYELVLSDARKVLVITENLIDKWELHEYDQNSKTGIGVKRNTFNTLAGALRVADEWVEHRHKTDYKFVNRNAKFQSLAPTEKQIKFIGRLWGRNLYRTPNKYPGTDVDKAYLWRVGEEKNVFIENREMAATLINMRTNK
jgi:hypothetical protein